MSEGKNGSIVIGHTQMRAQKPVFIETRRVESMQISQYKYIIKQFD